MPRLQRKRFCECKWTNDKVDASVLDTLIERSKLFHYKNVHFCIFSKSGFTKDCIKKANKVDYIDLVTFNEIIFN